MFQRKSAACLPIYLHWPISGVTRATFERLENGRQREANAARANRRGAITAEAPYSESCSSGPSGSDWCPAAA